MNRVRASYRARDLAAIRATREVAAYQNGETLACIAGVPLSGETIGDQIFDGIAEAAVFPGDLPDKADAVFAGATENTFKALRFRPPEPERHADGRLQAFPQIRLDRTIEFLIGDRL